MRRELLIVFLGVASTILLSCGRSDSPSSVNNVWDCLPNNPSPNSKVPIPFTSSEIDAVNSGDDKAVADIDLDGDQDGILAGGADGQPVALVWYESGANYARRVIRTTPVYAEFTTDMQAGDVDGDGDPDIVIADADGVNNVLWFENPLRNPPPGKGSDPRVAANWTYHMIGSHGDHVHDIEVGDVNHDGRLDVVTSGHGYAHLWLKTSFGTWSDKNLSSLAGKGVFLGDIDRDGDLDIATHAGWLETPVDPIGGTWVRHLVTGMSKDEVTVADLNGDARLDLVNMDAHYRAEVAWFEAPVDPKQAAWTMRVIDASMAAHHPEPADFNGDGRTDLLLGLERADLSIYLNKGGSPPTFYKQQLDTGAAHNARAGDLDGDGDKDVFGADYGGYPPVKIYINRSVSKRTDKNFEELPSD